LAGILADLRVAPLYRSTPESGADQPDYLNTAAVGYSLTPPAELLARLKKLEYLAGRRAGPRHGPRVLDIDLLLYGTEISDLPELRLPHPRLRDRGFVLVPLAEIAPEWPVPPDGVTVFELLERLRDQPRLEPLSWSAARC
jgi:2-amino-4-hydroxy-6-hydroxymethyldihydropteridine diphosphokinase